VVLASAESLSFPEGAFDKVLCVHVLYLFTDIGACLREIARDHSALLLDRETSASLERH
jgi:hypothetical protein